MLAIVLRQMTRTQSAEHMSGEAQPGVGAKRPIQSGTTARMPGDACLIAAIKLSPHFTFRLQLWRLPETNPLSWRAFFFLAHRMLLPDTLSER